MAEILFYLQIQCILMISPCFWLSPDIHWGFKRPMTTMEASTYLHCRHSWPVGLGITVFPLILYFLALKAKFQAQKLDTTPTCYIWLESVF